MAGMLAALFAISAAAIQPDIVITNTNAIDVETGQIAKNVDVVVHDGHISYIGQLGMLHSSSAPNLVDGHGKYLIPGLWDMHIHWYHEPSFGLFTANGVIGARVMFGQPNHLKWKKRIEAGEMVGPHLIVGSPIIDGPRPIWPGSWAVGKPGEGRAAIQRVKQEGWDFAKVYSGLSKSSYLEIADEAKKLGVPFEGHEPFSVSPKEVSEAGQRTVEHLGDYLFWMSSRREELLKALDASTDAEWPAKYWILQTEGYKSYDARKARDTYRAFAKNKTWQCPTLVTMVGLSRLREYLKSDDPRLKLIPPSWGKMWQGYDDDRYKSDPEGTYAAMRAGVEGRKRIVRDMHREGVGILVGTDCGNPFCFPGFSIHEELALFVESGLTPLQALRTATINPAKYMGQEKMRGNVVKGEIADLVLLDANPLQDIHNTAKVRAVIQSGRLFRRPELDDLIRIAEATSKLAKEDE